MILAESRLRLSLAVKGVKVSTSLSLSTDGVAILNRLMSVK